MAGPQRYTPEEFLITALAREVRDGETVGVGALSPIPLAACLLALLTHAPAAVPIVLGSREHFPFPAGTAELHFLAQRGRLDLFFLSGLQIDGEGNINLHLLGEYERPRLRLAGAYGSGLLYYMAKRVVLFRMEHSRRVLVERVDFVTAPGTSPEGVHRPGGPSKLYTPLAVLRFDRGRKGWELESYHPWTTPEEVQANTGFPLPLAEGCGPTPEPEEEALRLLRTQVRGKVEALYPRFAQERLLSPA